MYCEKCGEYLEENAIFCHACGHKVGRYGVHDGNIIDDFFIGDTDAAEKPKSRILAGVFAILFGALGVHDFYLGNSRTGIAKVLLTVFGLGGISELWSLIDAYKLFTGKISTDANGNSLTGSF